MPAKNPRVNVVLERPLYEALRRLARRDGTSLSLKARDLLRDTLETYEDLVLEQIAEERERTFDRSRALSHHEVWQALARRGLITLPQGTPDLRTRPVAIRGEPISLTLIRDRR